MKFARHVPTILCWCKDIDCRFYPGFDADGNKRKRPADYICPSRPADTRIGRKPAQLYMSNPAIDSSEDPAPHVERIVIVGDGREVKTFFTEAQMAEYDRQLQERVAVSLALA